MSGDDMWIILDEGLEVQVGNETFNPVEGDEFVVTAGTPHRISAHETAGRVLEIDFGFTSEDDVLYLEKMPGNVAEYPTDWRDTIE